MEDGDRGFKFGRGPLCFNESDVYYFIQFSLQVFAECGKLLQRLGAE